MPGFQAFIDIDLRFEVWVRFCLAFLHDGNINIGQMQGGLAG